MMYSNQPLKMPRLSHNKGKIRNKRLQRRQRLHQLVTAESPAIHEAFDAQEIHEDEENMLIEDEENMLTPEQLAAIIIVFDAREPIKNPENSVTVQDLVRFGPEAHTFFV